jgi:hypothetical protein
MDTGEFTRLSASAKTPRESHLGGSGIIVRTGSISGGITGAESSITCGSMANPFPPFGLSATEMRVVSDFSRGPNHGSTDGTRTLRSIPAFNGFPISTWARASDEIGVGSPNATVGALNGFATDSSAKTRVASPVEEGAAICSTTVSLEMERWSFFCSTRYQTPPATRKQVSTTIHLRRARCLRSTSPLNFIGLFLAF